LLRDELPRLEARIWQASEQETQDGLACNTGDPRCRGGRRGQMVAVPMNAQDDQRRQQVLRSHILPRWLSRCGIQCVDVWNQTIGPAHAISVTGPP
jgi:hypothetical protein